MPTLTTDTGAMLTIGATYEMANQRSISAATFHRDYGSTHYVTFLGPAYGMGPVVMLSGKSQTFVTDPGRCGDEFNADWVKRFYGVTA